MNELCYLNELEAGYSAHYIGDAICIYKNGKPRMQVYTKEQLHLTIKINMREDYKNEN